MDALHYIFLHMTGIDTQQSYYYDFWSGIGPCLLTAIALSSGIWAFIHRHNCHVRHCLALGHPNRDGVVYCKWHNPNGPATR